MEADLFQAFQEIAHQRAGIFLRPGKAALVQARLAKRLRELGLATEREYLARLSSDAEELVQFLDAISTNFTHFFREPDHFETVSEHVQAARAAGRRKFRFWSAGCSSGEEPYTLAMVLDDVLDGCDWRILATDLSTRVLARAAAGLYDAEEIAGIPPTWRRYVERAGTGATGERFGIASRIRERLVFHRLNLAAWPYPMTGPFDAIFCRNVMIYFDLPMRAGLVREVERLLRPGAPFLIGHSETLNGVPTALRSERPSVYRLREEAP